MPGRKYDLQEKKKGLLNLNFDMLSYQFEKHASKMT